MQFNGWYNAVRNINFAIMIFRKEIQINCYSQLHSNLLYEDTDAKFTGTKAL